jgi:hypothetical protein
LYRKYLTELCTMVDKAAVFAMTPCSPANLIGKCATREGAEFYYQGFAVDVATLAKECPDWEHIAATRAARGAHRSDASAKIAS